MSIRRIILLMFLFVLPHVVVASSLNAQDDFSCPGFDARLEIGMEALAIPDRSINLRTQSSVEAPVVNQIPRGDRVTVLNDPVCSDGHTWWQVNYNEQVGWIAGGNAEELWLMPRMVNAVLPNNSSPRVPPDLLRGISWGGGGATGWFIGSDPCRSDYESLVKNRYFVAAKTSNVTGIAGLSELNVVCSIVPIESAFLVGPEDTWAEPITEPRDYLNNDIIAAVYLPFEVYTQPGEWRLVVNHADPNAVETFDFVIDQPYTPYLIANLSNKDGSGNRLKILLGGFAPQDHIIQIVYSQEWTNPLTINIDEYIILANTSGYALLEPAFFLDSELPNHVIAFTARDKEVFVLAPVNFRASIQGRGEIEFGTGPEPFCHYSEAEFERLLYNVYWGEGDAITTLVKARPNKMVDVYSGPGFGYQKVGSLAYDQVLTLASRDENANWLRLDSDQPRWVPANEIGIFCGNVQNLADRSVDSDHSVSDFQIPDGTAVGGYPSGIILNASDPDFPSYSQSWEFDASPGETIAVFLQACGYGNRIGVFDPDGNPLSAIDQPLEPWTSSHYRPGVIFESVTYHSGFIENSLEFRIASQGIHNIVVTGSCDEYTLRIERR